MFEVGDLVRITNSCYYLNGEEIEGFVNDEMINKVGLVTEKELNPESNMYLILVIEDGAAYSYYYYEHEIEKV